MLARNPDTVHSKPPSSAQPQEVSAGLHEGLCVALSGDLRDGDGDDASLASVQDYIQESVDAKPKNTQPRSANSIKSKDCQNKSKNRPRPSLEEVR